MRDGAHIANTAVAKQPAELSQTVAPKGLRHMLLVMSRRARATNVRVPLVPRAPGDRARWRVPISAARRAGSVEERRFAVPVNVDWRRSRVVKMGFLRGT